MFSQASELGSLIEPQRAAQMADMSKQGQSGFSLAHEWDAVERQLHRALEREQGSDPAAQVFSRDDNDLIGTVRAAQLLGRTYTLVATNVPYLSRGSHSGELKDFADRTYPEAKKDLATLFLERCLRFSNDDGNLSFTGSCGGTAALVTPQNWLFLGAYRGLRKGVLERHSLNAVMRLGEHGFRSSQAAGAFTALTIISNAPPARENAFAGIDASGEPSPDAKARLLREGVLEVVDQERQTKNPDHRITIENLATGPLLCEYANSVHGLGTKDSPRFIRTYWDVPDLGTEWELLQSTVADTIPFGGLEYMIFWEQDKGILHERSKRGEAILAGRSAFDKPGVAVSQMRHLPASLYMRGLFDKNVAAIVPRNPENLSAVWAFCSSPEFNEAVRKIDAKINVTNATLVKVPFDLKHWQVVADELYPGGLPEPYSADPTQWLFDGTILGSDHPLQVAVARLLGYRWPKQADDDLDAVADPDGIVCLPSVYGEPSADIRLRELLRTAYGDAWSPDLLARLVRDVGASSLDGWLRDKKGFFAQHVKLFHNRPFLWHITDGRKDGFSAVVNYHKLTSSALSKLIYTYLGDWIGRQEGAVAREEAGAQGRLDAARPCARS